jgi:hypothetical protein
VRWDVEPERAAELARMARAAGWAVLALQDERVLEQRRAALDTAQALASAPLTGAGLRGGRGEAVHARPGACRRLDAWEEWWRDILLIAAGAGEAGGAPERLDSLRPLAAMRRAVGSVRAARHRRREAAAGGEREPGAGAEVMTLALPRLRPNAVTGFAGR